MYSPRQYDILFGTVTYFSLTPIPSGSPAKLRKRITDAHAGSAVLSRGISPWLRVEGREQLVGWGREPREPTNLLSWEHGLCPALQWYEVYQN